MKRIFPVIVIFLLAAFLSGCGMDEYSIERKYWHLQKKISKIINNPAATPPRELENMVSLLKKFKSEYPKSNLSIKAVLDIANLYLVKEEFEKARTHLKMLLTTYHDNPPILAEITYLIGNSYEKEDKWDSALSQYKKIMQEYPITMRGMTIPLYIAKYYKKQYQPDKMINAYQEAILHYRNLADKYPDTPLSYNLYLLVSDCYISLRDWQGAINNINFILESYRGKTSMEEVLLNKAMVYAQGLKNKEKAKEVLENMLKEYPKSRFINTIKDMLKRLSQSEVGAAK